MVTIVMDDLKPVDPLGPRRIMVNGIAGIVTQQMGIWVEPIILLLCILE